MIHIRHGERAMFKHTAEVMSDRMSDEPNQWVGDDHRAVAKIGVIGEAKTSALVITGDELHDGPELFRQIVEAELDNWVPGASQRLLRRASAALGQGYRSQAEDGVPDCGPEASRHALIGDWVAGLFIRHCITCGHLFKDA